MQIRKVEEKDIEQIVDIKIRGWQSAYRGIIDDKFLDLLNREEKIAKIKKDYAISGFIVAEEEDEVLGFCRYVEENEFSKEQKEIEAEICALYVKPEWKRKGVGRLMIEYALNDLKQIGKSKIILWCLKENDSARIFYEEMGGTLFAEKKIEIGNRMYDEVAYVFEV